MKAMIRAAKIVLGVAATGLPAASLAAQTTRTIAPPEGTPRLMVATFRATDKGLGAQTAEEVGKKIQDDMGIKKIFVIPRKALCDNLGASGFSCDSTLDPITAKLLATQLRADEYLEGTVTKTPNGFRVEPRMVLTRDNNMVQPLPVAQGNKLGDIASQISKSLQAARGQLPAERKCELAIANGNAQEAVAAAKEAITAYPQSTIGRICLANAYKNMKMPPDSIIGVAKQVTGIDPHSKPALRLLADAYRAKGDVDAAVDAASELIAADPRNASLATEIVNFIASSGRAERAVPIINRAVQENPGDPDLVRLQWLVLLAAKQWKPAVQAGEEMARTDTAAADTTFFTRLAAAYAADSQPQKAAEATARGVAKFPKNASLWSLNCQTQRLAGQTQKAIEACNQAIALDPKAEHVWLRKAQAEMDLKQPDSVVAALKQASANGEDKATISQFMLVLGNQKYKEASDTTQPPQARMANYQQAISLLSAADSMAANDNAKFVLGVSAFKLGDLAVRQNQNAKSCDLAKVAQQSFVTAQINSAAAGKIDPKVAQALLTAIPQYQPVVDAQVKRFCK